MPLHKSGRAHRLDPTMISAPLGDFRHTMHIGRGGDAFGDTSFLSSHGPSNTESFKSAPSPMSAAMDSSEMTLSCDGDGKASEGEFPELRHSESVSSFDLDLDLGPSILGDVLGVMDGLGLGTTGIAGMDGDEEVCSSNKSGPGGDTLPASLANDLRVQNKESLNRGEEHLNDVNGVKSKGLRPKVRFSDKKEEIIGHQYVADGPEAEREEETCTSPVERMQMSSGEMGNKEKVKPDSTNHQADNSPSPSSSVSSEYEGVSPLDRRREDNLSESCSDEEGVAGEQGYTFEDESDDEIGL